MGLLRYLVLALTGLAVTACASTPSQLPRASAVPETVRVTMDVDPRDNGLNWSQIALIETLAAEYKARGHGPLVISYPQNAGNAEAAIAAIAEARTRLYAHGLDWTQIAGGAYEAGGELQAPVLFSFNRYQAVAPDCPVRWTDLTNAEPGRHWPRFGCATAANLAAMVADPRDLETPRTFGAPDAARRQTVLENYRRGEATGSQRTGDDSGAVSDAVEN
jgi:pilus assembly protein CpaD